MKKILRPNFGVGGGKPLQIDEVVQLVRKFVGKSMEVFRMLESVILRPMTLDELAHTYSQATDQIVREAIQEGLKFAGGKFRIAYASEHKIEVSMEAYFQNAESKWIKKSNVAEISSSKLDDEAFEELKRIRAVEYELEAPHR